VLGWSEEAKSARTSLHEARTTTTKDQNLHVMIVDLVFVDLRGRGGEVGRARRSYASSCDVVTSDTVLEEVVDTFRRCGSSDVGGRIANVLTSELPLPNEVAAGC
jgi:hypothetical protein